MLWFFLATVFVAGVFLNYLWLVVLAVLVLLLKLFPLITLPSMAAFIIWFIKIHWRK